MWGATLQRSSCGLVPSIGHVGSPEGTTVREPLERKTVHPVFVVIGRLL